MSTSTTDVTNLEKIHEWCTMFGLDWTVEEKAHSLLVTYPKQNVSKKVREVREAGALYSAMRLDPLCPAITLKYFAEKVNLTVPEVGREYRRLMTASDSKPQACSIKPGPFMDHLLKKLEAPENVRKRALYILEKAAKSGLLIGRNPVDVAAAAIYVACIIEYRYQRKKPFTEDEIAAAAGISVVSVRNNYRPLTLIWDNTGRDDH